MAKEAGVSPAQLAIAWCLENPAITSVISAATKLEQLVDNLAAADIEIPNDVMARIEEIFPEPETVESEQ